MTEGSNVFEEEETERISPNSDDGEIWVRERDGNNLLRRPKELR